MILIFLKPKTTEDLNGVGRLCCIIVQSREGLPILQNWQSKYWLLCLAQEENSQLWQPVVWMLARFVDFGICFR